jgi:inorganic pyrophosphatase/exopolyphosphatase
MNKILVTAKINPDLDGTSCTLAYSDLLKQFGKDADGLITGSPQSEVKFFIEKRHIQIPTRSDEVSNEWNQIILVDASSTKGMPKTVKAAKVIELIDHRPGEPEKEFPQAKIQNELVGAAATLIVEKFIQANKKPQIDHAKLLYGAIYHNSLNFIATNTSQRDKDAAKYLETNYGFSEEIIREMFNYATHEIENDIKKALKDDAKEIGNDMKIGAYQIIVWGREVVTNSKSIIESSVNELTTELGLKWSFVNVIELESKQSHIFTHPKGEEILSKALNSKFKNNWSTLPAILRKQIIPKVTSYISSQN